MVCESREALLQAQEREKDMQARMHDEIRKQVQIAMSAQRQGSDPGINIISPPDQLKSSCASTELPNQDDVMLRFPVDDITAPFTSCELHILKENTTIMVALDVFSPPDPTKTPRIHGAIIPPGYVSVLVDRVNKGFSDLALDILGGDGEKTQGEVEKTFTLWRKRYIIIPGVSSPPPLPQLPDNRCGQR